MQTCELNCFNKQFVINENTDNNAKNEECYYYLPINNIIKKSHRIINILSVENIEIEDCLKIFKNEIYQSLFYENKIENDKIKLNVNYQSLNQQINPKINIENNHFENKNEKNNECCEIMPFVITFDSLQNVFFECANDCKPSFENIKQMSQWTFTRT